MQLGLIGLKAWRSKIKNKKQMLLSPIGGEKHLLFVSLGFYG